MTVKLGKATIYTRGFVGYVKREVKSVAITTRPYAQYSKAVQITFREPRQRRDRSFIETSHASTVILEGWGHVDPPSAWEPVAAESACAVVQRARYSGCDPQAAVDFDAALAAHVNATGTRIALDLRGWNPY